MVWTAKDEEDYPKKEKNNCKKNKKSAECIPKKAKKIKGNFKSKMPEYLKDVEAAVEAFADLKPAKQRVFLNNLRQTINTLAKKGTSPELIQECVKISSALIQRDCSETTNFDLCREEKKIILHEVLIEFNKLFKCKNLLDFLKKSELGSVEETAKSMLLLFSDITSNSDSLNKGDSKVLYEYGYCLKDNFENIYEVIKESLPEASEEDLTKIKADLKEFILKILSHLLDLVHYDEVDGYLEDAKKKDGLIITEDSKKTKQEIEDAMKLLLEDGTGHYDLDNLDAYIQEGTKTEPTSRRNLRTIELRKGKESEEIVTYDFPEYGIKVNVFLDKLFNQFEEGTLEVKIIDNYPFVSAENEDVLKSFVSMKLYKKNGELVNVKNVKKEIMPEILFPKTSIIPLQNCYYYNEEKESLESDGLSYETRTIDGVDYAVCKMTHFTDFTAGKGSKVLMVILILLGIALVAGLVALIYFKLLKKNKGVEGTQAQMETLPQGTISN
ncbi:MAG: hypothetical protein MJ252_27550 [archaeon]|nr:hypothetical protein [archaeon]